MQKPDSEPILEEQTYWKTLDYIALQAIALVRTVIGTDIALDTLTVFAHDMAEYQFMDKLLRKYGPESKLTHGVTLYVDTNLDVKGQQVKLLGVRSPDPTRPQVGYADFPSADFEIIQNANNPYVQPITSGTGKILLELRHPDFDVLGYIVRPEDHE